MAIDLPAKRHKSTLDSLDKISNLPKEVTDEIFKRMPIRDAVKTSMLSTAWRYKWMSMPDIVFDTRSIPSATEGGTSANLVNFVNNVLLLHKGDISKFEINKFFKQGVTEVDRWILVISRTTTLTHIALVFKLSDPYKVPSCLFMCENLSVLRLEGCSLELPAQYKGLRCLVRLTLCSVYVTNQTLEKMVTSSPLIQFMTLSKCFPLTRLNLCAPKLSVFGFDGHCEIINLQNTPNIGRLGIQASYFPEKFTTCRLDEVLGSLASISYITIWYPFMEVPPADSSPKGLPITYNRLKNVKLRVNMEDSKQIFAVLCLFRSSPYMERLVLAADWNSQNRLSYDANFWERRLCKEPGLLNHLKTVRLLGFKDGQHALDFLQFILLNAVVLDTFTIKWDESIKKNLRLLPIFQRMMQFKRASCEAKVVFSDLKYEEFW